MQNALKLVASDYKWYILVPFSVLCVFEIYGNGIWKVELGMTNTLIRAKHVPSSTLNKYHNCIYRSAFCRQKSDSTIVIIYPPNLPMISFKNNP
jgi:hypothetical protein